MNQENSFSNAYCYAVDVKKSEAVKGLILVYLPLGESSIYFYTIAIFNGKGNSFKVFHRDYEENKEESFDFDDLESAKIFAEKYLKDKGWSLLSEERIKQILDSSKKLNNLC